MAKKHAAEWMFDEDEPRVVAVAHARGKALLRLSNEKTLKVSGTALQMVGLVRGDVIDAAMRKRLVEAEAVADAVRKGVRMLAASAKTAAEVRERLLAKDLDAKVVERAVAYLVERGLIDDAEVAKRVSADRTASREMARQVMEARGVDGAVAEEMLAKRGSDARGATKAVRVLAAKLPASLSVSAKRGRLLSALARRGFEEHDAVDAVDGYLRGE
jgi:SOS response regulatory protein OraA/RecX